MGITVRQLALRIGEDRKVVKGAAMGLGVKLHVTPCGTWMSFEDADRVEAVIDGYRAEALAVA